MVKDYKDLQVNEKRRKMSKSFRSPFPVSRTPSSGQALLFVFFLLLIVGILAGALAIMWQAEMKTRGSEKEGLIAFYLAQAGVERAKIWSRHNPSVTSYLSPWFSLGGGRYRFTVSPAGPNRRRLQGIGQVRDSTNRVIAEKRITVVVEGVGTPSTSDDHQQPWSWREI